MTREQLNPIVLKELERLEKYGATVEEMIQKYTIQDEETKAYIKGIAEEKNGVIPERYINKIGLTPRHIQITFNGLYRVKTGDSF